MTNHIYIVVLNKVSHDDAAIVRRGLVAVNCAAAAPRSTLIGGPVVVQGWLFKNRRLQRSLPHFLSLSKLVNPARLNKLRIKYVLGFAGLMLTLSCSESAWKVLTEVICWKRLRQIKTKACSSLEETASAALTSWMKNLSKESGCLWTTYFMLRSAGMLLEDNLLDPGVGQLSPKLDF